LHSSEDITSNTIAMPVLRTRALLREIADAQLITEVAPGRFAWHDLLHAYTAEQLRGRPLRPRDSRGRRTRRRRSLSEDRASGSLDRLEFLRTKLLRRAVR
jgi:hypothetical protein